MKNKLMPNINEVQNVREILGSDAKQMSDDQVKNLLALTDSMLEGWFDSFERGIFGGKTINDLTKVNH